MLSNFEGITEAGIKRKVYQLKFTKIMTQLYTLGKHTFAKDYLYAILKHNADFLEPDEVEGVVEKLYDYTFRRNAFYIHNFEIIPILREAGYNPTQIAKIAGIARPTVYANLNKTKLQLHMLNDGLMIADNEIVNRAIRVVVDVTSELTKGALMIHGEIN